MTLVALITTFSPAVAGTPPTYGAAAAGDTVRPGTTLVVKNGSASSITATLVTPGNLRTGDAYPDKQYTVAAGAEAWIPVLSDYADPTDGLARVNWSATTSVTRAAVYCP